MVWSENEASGSLSVLAQSKKLLFTKQNLMKAVHGMQNKILINYRVKTTYEGKRGGRAFAQIMYIRMNLNILIAGKFFQWHK